MTSSCCDESASQHVHLCGVHTGQYYIKEQHLTVPELACVLRLPDVLVRCSPICSRLLNYVPSVSINTHPSPSKELGFFRVWVSVQTSTIPIQPVMRERTSPPPVM